jgi:hypothetical protein
VTGDEDIVEVRVDSRPLFEALVWQLRFLLFMLLAGCQAKTAADRIILRLPTNLSVHIRIIVDSAADVTFFHSPPAINH